VRCGERKRVPYENPQGRRYNTLVLYAPHGVQPGLSRGFERAARSPAFRGHYPGIRDHRLSRA